MSSRVTEARGDKRESLTNNFGIFRHAGILKWTAFTKQSGKRVMRFGAYYTQNDGMAVSGSVTWADRWEESSRIWDVLAYGAFFEKLTGYRSRTVRLREFVSSLNYSAIETPPILRSSGETTTMFPLVVNDVVGRVIYGLSLCEALCTERTRILLVA